MQPKRRGTPRETPFEYFPELTIGNRTLWPGDHFKVTGTRNKTFEFHRKRVDTRDGSETIVAFGPVSMYGKGSEHVFRPERVKLIPKRRKRVKK